jgi:ribosomal protein S4E
MRFPWPLVFPKGKARKEAKKADYRTSLFAYVRRYCHEIDGTSGVIRMSIENGEVFVNGNLMTDSHFQVKPGDIVSFRFVPGTYVVTADEIERTWR